MRDGLSGSLIAGSWTIETKTTPITEQISIPSNYGPFKDTWSGIIPVPAEQRQEIRQEAFEGRGGGARTKPFTGQGSSMPADTVTLIRSETQKLATFFAVRSSLVAKSWMSAAEGWGARAALDPAYSSLLDLYHRHKSIKLWWRRYQGSEKRWDNTCVISILR